MTNYYGPSLHIPRIFTLGNFYHPQHRCFCQDRMRRCSISQKRLGLCAQRDLTVEYGAKRRKNNGSVKLECRGLLHVGGSNCAF
jgi:hypothetical protein